MCLIQSQTLSEVATETARMSVDYRDIMELVKECKMMIKRNKGLILRQASLVLSLSQLNRSKGLQNEENNGKRPDYIT